MYDEELTGEKAFQVSLTSVRHNAVFWIEKRAKAFLSNSKKWDIFAKHTKRACLGLVIPIAFNDTKMEKF